MDRPQGGRTRAAGHSGASALKTSDGDLELSVLQGSGPVDIMIERAFATNTWPRIGDAE
jgi:hypothetical protein